MLIDPTCAVPEAIACTSIPLALIVSGVVGDTASPLRSRRLLVPSPMKEELPNPAIKVVSPEAAPTNVWMSVNWMLVDPTCAVPVTALIVSGVVGDTAAPLRSSRLLAPSPMKEELPNPAIKVVSPEAAPTKVWMSVNWMLVDPTCAVPVTALIVSGVVGDTASPLRSGRLLVPSPMQQALPHPAIKLVLPKTTPTNVWMSVNWLLVDPTCAVP